MRNLKFNKRSKAFTLLEIIIVVGITAVLAGVSITYYASQKGSKTLDAAAQEITGYLRYAQRKSIAQQEGKQWGVHFENPASGRGSYSLYTGATYSSPVETRYLPAGIEFQIPSSNSSSTISFDKLTGSFSETYKQITIENDQGETNTVLACSQGIIEQNSDIGICGLVNSTPPVIGAITPENVSYGAFVDSPFDLTVSITEEEGGATSCEYTANGGTDWLTADLSGTGPGYTCTKEGITSSDGTALSLNMRAVSSGGTGTGTAVARTVDAVAPTSSDDWIDDWTATSSVIVTTTSTDDGSGVASTKYCVDTADTCTPSTTGTSVSVTCASGSTCVQHVRYSAEDNVGNASSVYSKTVGQDLQNPSDGTLIATGGSQLVDLSWSGFSDAGSGLAAADTYKLVYSTSTTPADCNVGTQTYLGTNTTYPHTGLTDGLTYYYRVCAFDSVNNVSTGATAQAIPSSCECSVEDPCCSNGCDYDADSTVCSVWGSCSGSYSSTCDESCDGTQSASTCVSGACSGSTSQSCSCGTRDTDGTSCGTKDCDYLNYYFTLGTASPTGTNYCKYRNYVDQTKYCSTGSCGDPTCSSYADSTAAPCGTCVYATGACSSCTTYNNTTSCGTPTTCSGSYSSTCDETCSGTQTVYTCNGAGTCGTSTPTCSCGTRDTDGITCGDCGSCSYSSICDNSGDGTQPTCSNSSCTGSVSCACTRNTNGTLCCTAGSAGCPTESLYCAGGYCGVI